MHPEPTPSLRVLVMGGIETRFHHFDDLAPALVHTISSAGHTCTQLLAVAALHPPVLKGFDAIVSITTGGVLEPEQESALLGAIEFNRNDRQRPVHFLGLHGASCSFTDSAAYLRMLGGRFLGHPPIGEFEVEALPPLHSITEGLLPFVIEDECYELELYRPVQVILGTRTPSSDVEHHLPLGWVKRHGAGKVCYLALGHGPKQLAHPSMVQLIQGALRWFALTEVAIGADPRTA